MTTSPGTVSTSASGYAAGEEIKLHSLIAKERIGDSEQPETSTYTVSLTSKPAGSIHMAVVVVAANGTDDQAAAAAAALACGNARRPADPVDVDTRMLMAARRGNSELLKSLLLNKDVDVEAGSASLLPRVTMEGDTVLHVVAACGDDDAQKFLDCVDVIVCYVEKKKAGAGANKRVALEARNNKLDTPLHCAAGAGNARMISCLIDLIANDGNDDDETAAAMKKALVRMQNECGETALHQAVRAPKNNEACIDKLMKHDPDLACVLHKNGTSPLYLAISLGKLKIAYHLHSKSKGKLSYSGPDGSNVLHAAVVYQGLLFMSLEWLKDVETTMSSGSSVAAAPDLLSQLTNQRDRQQKGSTPLHLAASLDSWLTKLLLDANESTAYLADDEGSYPIHVAVWCGRLAVVKRLLERCPDCATLRDGKGRTFLHVAVEKERHAVVEYVCRETMPQQLSSMMILNAQDSNGETALHGAVRAGNLAVFNCLLRNPRVRLDVANKDGMTARDLSCTMHPSGFHYSFNRTCIVRNSLFAAGAPRGYPRLELLTATDKPNVDQESKKYAETTQVKSIVAALIATVTFASAFTLPGGYRADGEPALAGRYAFDAFVLADTLAFICSITATCTLVYAGFPDMDIDLRFRHTVVSEVLLQSAARSLVAAFGLGLYLVLAPFHHTAIAIAACAIVFASSLYGNIEAWRLIHMATTVLARIGIRRYAVMSFVRQIFIQVMIHFGSYVIIFGLPTIGKWVIPAIRKWVHQKQQL